LQTEPTEGSGNWDNVEDFATDGPDVIPVSLFLEAAQLNLESTANAYLGDVTPLSYRVFGSVVMNLIQYDNILNFYTAPEAIMYNYRPAVVQDIDSYETQNFWFQFPNYPVNSTVGRHIRLTRRGIRIVCVPGGLLGKFQFQQLLLSLTTSLALIKIAATIVDTLATRILPMRAVYNEKKYEQTEDFSSLRRQLKLKRIQALADATNKDFNGLEPMSEDEFQGQLTDLKSQVELLERARYNSAQISNSRRASMIDEEVNNIEMTSRSGRNVLYSE